MSLRLEMLEAARRAPRVLGESSERVVEFLRSQINDDGGFRDRSGASDLYYTVFGLEGLIAVGGEVPFAKIRDYLRGFGEGESLDLVHLGCLGRCWANLPVELRGECPGMQILARIERHRAGDGGYHASRGAAHGTVYGCFLAAASYEDLGAEMPNRLAMLNCLNRLRAEDGGYANQDEMKLGLTPSTSAAVTLLRQLGQTVEPSLGEWLLSRCRAEGGFFATPMAPIPDLLSTATALHALAGMGVSLEQIKEPCLDFIDSLWTNRGGFYGHWADDVQDCEYTYYALLALGHLSV